MKEECEMCGATPYEEIETEEGVVTMCKECYTSYTAFMIGEKGDENE